MHQFTSSPACFPPSLLPALSWDGVSYSLGWPQTYYVPKDDHELLISLPLHPDCWGYRRAAPCLVYTVLGDGTQSFVQAMQALFLLSHTLKPQLLFQPTSSLHNWVPHSAITEPWKERNPMDTCQSRTTGSSSLSVHLSPPALEVTWACSQQNVVGMPVQAEDRGANWLLNVLAHPPKKREKLVYIVLTNKNGNIFQATQ